MLEEVFFALEVVIDQGFRDTGLIGDLEGGGAFKALFGQKAGCCANDVLLLLQNALIRDRDGHEGTGFLVALKIFTPDITNCQA